MKRPLESPSPMEAGGCESGRCQREEPGQRCRVGGELAGLESPWRTRYCLGARMLWGGEASRWRHQTARAFCPRPAGGAPLLRARQLLAAPLRGRARERMDPAVVRPQGRLRERGLGPPFPTDTRESGTADPRPRSSPIEGHPGPLSSPWPS